LICYDRMSELRLLETLGIVKLVILEALGIVELVVMGVCG